MKTHGLHLKRKAFCDQYCVDEFWVEMHLQVIGELIFAPEPVPPTLVRDKAAEDLARLTGRHNPERVPPSPTWKKPVKRCVVCSAKGSRVVSVYFCKLCPSQPGLCAAPCFQLYHTQLNYAE